MIRSIPREERDVWAAHFALWDEPPKPLYRRRIAMPYLPHIAGIKLGIWGTSIYREGGSIYFCDVTLFTRYERLLSFLFVGHGLPPYHNSNHILDFDADSAPDVLDLLMILLLDGQDVSLLSVDRRLSVLVSHDGLVEVRGEETPENLELIGEIEDAAEDDVPRITRTIIPG